MNLLEKRKRLLLNNNSSPGFMRETEADNVISLDTFGENNLLGLKLFGKTTEVLAVDEGGNTLEKSIEHPCEFASIENPEIVVSGRNLLNKNNLIATTETSKVYTTTDTGFRQELVGTMGYNIMVLYDITNLVKPGKTYYFHRELEKNYTATNNTSEVISGSIRIYVDGKLYANQYNTYGNDMTFTLPESFDKVDIRTYSVVSASIIQDYDETVTYYQEWKNVYLSMIPYEEYVPYDGEEQVITVPYTLRGLYVVPNTSDTYVTYLNDTDENYISDSIEFKNGRVYYVNRVAEATASTDFPSGVSIYANFYNTYERYVFGVNSLPDEQLFTGYRYDNLSRTWNGYAVLCNYLQGWHGNYNGTYDNDYRIGTGAAPGSYASFTFFSVPKSHFPDLDNPTIDELRPLCLNYLRSLSAKGNLKFCMVIKPPTGFEAYPEWAETDITDTEFGQALKNLKTYKHGTVISTNTHLSAKYYSNIKGEIENATV